MSRGLGRLQRQILEELKNHNGWVPITSLAHDVAEKYYPERSLWKGSDLIKELDKPKPRVLYVTDDGIEVTEDNMRDIFVYKYNHTPLEEVKECHKTKEYEEWTKEQVRNRLVLNIAEMMHVGKGGARMAWFYKRPLKDVVILTNWFSANYSRALHSLFKRGLIDLSYDNGREFKRYVRFVKLST